MNLGAGVGGEMEWKGGNGGSRHAAITKTRTVEAFAGETGGGNIETCKYKIAQFKTQTKEEVGMGHGAWQGTY